MNIKKIVNTNFTKKSDITRGVLDQNNGLSEENTARFIAQFSEINIEWLITGKGDMIKSDSLLLPNGGKEGENGKVPPKNEGADKEDQPHLIPLYDGVVTAGTMSVADMGGMAEPVEYVNAGDWFRDATAAMRVHGDKHAMPPHIYFRYHCRLKEVKNKRLIVFGEDYLIETSEYRVVKRIQRSEQKEYISACSTNLDTWDAG